MQQIGTIAEGVELAAGRPDAVLEDAEPRARGQLELTWRRFRRHRLAVVGLVVLLGMLFVAVAAPLVAPYDPNTQDSELARFGEPAAPSWAHPFGSDNLGRDYLSRTIYGSRVSLVVGFLSTGLAIIVGTVAGAVAGYTGRWVDMESCGSATCCSHSRPCSS